MRNNRILSFGLVAMLGLSGVCLAGCGGRISQLSDASSPIVTVGNTNIKKGDAYNRLMKIAGGYTAVSDAKSVISNAEIPDSDEINETATSAMNNYKLQMGDRFNTYLETIGMTEEEYLSDVLIPSIKNSKLAEKYVTDNIDDVTGRFHPVLASIITVNSESVAENVAKALADDSADPSSVASDNGGTYTADAVVVTDHVSDSNTAYDSAVRDYLKSSDASNAWTTVDGSNGSYYVVKKSDTAVTSENAAAIAADTDVTSEAMQYYFKKYNFEVYDSSLYNQIKETSPDYLVQDSKK